MRICTPDRRAVLGVVILVACTTSIPVSAQQIFRCTANGKTVVSDQPCADSGGMQSAPKSVTTPGNLLPSTLGPAPMPLNYSTPYGEWRGQTQYQATESGQLLQKAHAVVGLTLMVDPAGKVTGASQENGCKLLGVAAPFVGPTSLSLDVTFSGCHFAGYNRRFSGYLTLNQTQKTASLTLNAHQIMVGKATNFDIRATLRR